MVRMRSLLLPAFLAFTAAVLPPNASIGQDAGFGRDADVHVREDSFACKETSELDRLLQRNQSGGFTSGVQLSSRPLAERSQPRAAYPWRCNSNASGLRGRDSVRIGGIRASFQRDNLRRNF
jgi:hypothetical protein